MEEMTRDEFLAQFQIHAASAIEHTGCTRTRMMCVVELGGCPFLGNNFPGKWEGNHYSTTFARAAQYYLNHKGEHALRAAMIFILEHL